MWDIISDETSVKTIAGRKAKTILDFTNTIKIWQRKALEDVPAGEILQGLIDDTGYVRALQDVGTDEALDRVQNVNEIYNAMVQYADDEADESLSGFLANASLASDLDGLEEGGKAVTLMTLHAAKGLEFPVVFMVGMEEGLFPNFRSQDDPRALEEERRLCYVGITRAKEFLCLTHASMRRLWGNYMPAAPSQFLSELPEDLIDGDGLPSRQRHRAIARIHARTTPKSPKPDRTSTTSTTSATSQSQATTSGQLKPWKLGQHVIHAKFGVGEIVMVFGTEKKQSLAIKFQQGSTKIVNPLVEQLQAVK
ncbi:MAG: hypothetical protein EAZ61_12765 [Oscillatoriales cyanobacterium]|nr:MAG: hypothetical protein EAZ61_12765 [Oscillatoriales cyanobacterium]